ERDQTSLSIGQHLVTHGTFHWDGIRWTAGDLGHRLALVGCAVALALLAALFFGRFDPEKEGGRARSAPPEGVEAKTAGASGRRRRALPDWHPSSPFLALVLAELRLLLQGRSVWWYLVALGLAVTGLFAPLDAVHAGLLPVAWLWPLGLWSALGAREALFDT